MTLESGAECGQVLRFQFINSVPRNPEHRITECSGLEGTSVEQYSRN